MYRRVLKIHQSTVVVESLRCSFTVDHTHLLGYFAADVDRWVGEVPWLSKLIVDEPCINQWVHVLCLQLRPLVKNHAGHV